MFSGVQANLTQGLMGVPTTLDLVTVTTAVKTKDARRNLTGAMVFL